MCTVMSRKIAANVCVSAVVPYRSHVLSHETIALNEDKTLKQLVTAPLRKHFVGGSYSYSLKSISKMFSPGNTIGSPSLFALLICSFVPHKYQIVCPVNCGLIEQKNLRSPSLLGIESNSSQKSSGNQSESLLAYISTIKSPL